MTNCTNDIVLPLITDPCGGERTLTGCVFSNKGFASLGTLPNSSLEAILDVLITSLNLATNKIRQQSIEILGLQNRVLILESQL